MSRKSYTSDEIEATERIVPERVRADIVKNISDFLVEFTQTSRGDADEFSLRVVPVVLALIEDGMRTGRMMAEEEFKEMVHSAIQNIQTMNQSGAAFPPSAN